MTILDDKLTAQLRELLTKVREPIELVAARNDSETSTKMLALLHEIAELNGQVTVDEADYELRPSFAIRRAGDPTVKVRFAGVPLGHEFSSLVLALLQVGGHPAKISDTQREAIEALPAHQLRTYMSLGCAKCPDVVQSLNTISIINPKVEHLVVDGAAFQDEVEELGIMSVPAVVEGEEIIWSGLGELDDFIGLLGGAEKKLPAGVPKPAGISDEPGQPALPATSNAVENPSAVEPYEVLVVGGGPAAVTAAIYTACKGIRTGLVTDRRGGQILDTDVIENYVSRVQTTGKDLARDFYQHLGSYPVDLFIPQLAVQLVAGKGDSSGGSGFMRGLLKIVTNRGANLETKTLIIATGFGWRTLGVPGEEEYRNRGVSFCPHCDGPLFKGKKLAVVGGGNSGVEAAIDLTPIAAHVTVVEFRDELKADQVLVDELRRRDNIDVITGAQITEIFGDGKRVTGLNYRDHHSETMKTLELDGVFIQIGMRPNTQWLEGVVELNQWGQIVTDNRGATSVPGVYAAGDCTNQPYKQIVIAQGSGVGAALGAFEYLIRSGALQKAS